MLFQVFTAYLMSVYKSINKTPSDKFSTNNFTTKIPKTFEVLRILYNHRGRRTAVSQAISSQSSILRCQCRKLV